MTEDECGCYPGSLAPCRCLHNKEKEKTNFKERFIRAFKNYFSPVVWLWNLLRRKK